MINLTKEALEIALNSIQSAIVDLSSKIAIYQKFTVGGGADKYFFNRMEQDRSSIQSLIGLIAELEKPEDIPEKTAASEIQNG